MAEHEPAVALMVRWLRAGITGCEFARVFATQPAPGEVRPVVIRNALAEPPVADILQPILLKAAEEHAAVLAIFPDLRHDEEVADLAASLSRHPSWTLSEPQWPMDARRDDVLVALEWATPSQHVSNALGLGPLGSMPITRRSPLVGLVVWPGAHENPHRDVRYKRVGVADMKHSLSKAKHNTFWEKSQQNKVAYTSEERVTAARHDVTFCLRGDVRSSLPFSRPA
jgi:hypothetical protein